MVFVQVIAAHFALDAAYGVVGVGDSLTFCNTDPPYARRF